MIRNYFKIAIRTLIRNKGYAAINIIGLSVGIAASLLLFMVVNYEFNYDKDQKNFNQICRIVTQNKHSDGIRYNAGVPTPLLESIRTQFPQVKVGALDMINGSQISVPSQTDNEPNKLFIENTGLYFMEPQFLDIIDYTFLAGNAGALKEPNMIILSKTLAEKYFGDWQSAMGKMIKLDNAILLKVSGILQDKTLHSDFPLHGAVSFETLKKNPALYNYSTDWGNTSSNFQVFVRLPENLSVASFNKNLLDFCHKQYKDQRNNARIHFAQPLADIHFDTRFENLGDHVTTRATLRTLEFVGILIIIMACINFINLSTAQAISRSKEVGVRKVLGGNRAQLFWQMMGETALVVVMAVALAVGLAKLSLPYIKHIASVEEMLAIFNWPGIIFLVAVTLLVSLLSGIYPSLILSGFTPALALKNKMNSASIGGISLRKGLVVLQFAISQILVIGTIIAISQMNFVRHADLGFNKDALYVLNINSDSLSLSKEPAFRDALLKLPGIRSVSYCSDVPSSDNNWGTNFAFDHGTDQDFTLFLKFGDADYVKTYGLQLLAGKNYARGDTPREVLVNETLLHHLGIQNPSEALGKTIRMGGGQWKEIVGVLKDFKTNSLRETVKPILLAPFSKQYGRVGIKLNLADIVSNRARIEKTWNQFYPDFAFNAFFLDENIAQFYRQEEHLSTIYKIFAGLAIFISCLGLYGLVSFMAVQKTKEVGIRKVLGASVGHIVYLFSREFTLLIGIAFLIAMPAAWYLMTSWLNNFAYRIPMGAWIFLLAVGISLAIAWITVGYKAIRAALANPVQSLRTE